MNPEQKHLVVIGDREAVEAAQQLASRLSLPLESNCGPTAQPAFRLSPGPEGLTLSMLGAGAPGPVSADFASPNLNYRVKDAVQKQAIARAVGVKSGIRPTVVDGTAGLGRDAFLLASLGCKVSMVESDPIIHALLDDALRRARVGKADGNPALVETVARMQLSFGNFCTLASGMQKAEVVYLDPMFPKRGKSARVKKDMFVLQQYFAAAGNNQYSETELFKAALLIASRRIVVKRPRLALPLANMEPSFSLTGASSRYDVYLCSEQPQIRRAAV